MPGFVADPHLASMSQRAGEVLRRRALAQLPSGQLTPMSGLQRGAQQAALAARAQVAPPPPGNPYTTPTYLPPRQRPHLGTVIPGSYSRPGDRGYRPSPFPVPRTAVRRIPGAR